MADWVVGIAALLRSLADAIGRHVPAGAVLHADDTTEPVLERGPYGPGPDGCGQRWARSGRSLL